MCTHDTIMLLKYYHMYSLSKPIIVDSISLQEINTYKVFEDISYLPKAKLMGIAKHFHHWFTVKVLVRLMLTQDFLDMRLEVPQSFCITACRSSPRSMASPVV